MEFKKDPKMKKTDDLLLAMNKLTKIVESRRPKTKIIDLFPGLKRAGRDDRITASAFAFALESIECDDCITIKEAGLVFDYLDSNQKGFVSCQQFITFLEKFMKAPKHGHNLKILVQKDEVFPSWLVDRSDFQKVFPRFTATDEKHEDTAVLKKAFSTSIHSRSHEHLRIMAKWIEQQPSLEKVGSGRAWKLAQVLEYTTLSANKVLFNQGDPEDYFYVIFSGEVAILVNGQQVAIFGPGKTFGEQALENRSPRAATVKAIGFCEFLKLAPKEYRKIMVNERRQKLKETIEFLKRIWNGGKYKDSPKAKTIQLAQALHRQKLASNEVIFDQGAEPSLFYIVLCGSAELRKVVQVTTKNSWPVGKRAKDKVTRVMSSEKLVHLKDTRVGDHFGEDTLFHFTGRQYRAVATQDGTELLIINRHDIKDFLSEEEQHAIYEENKYLYTSPTHVKGLYESDNKSRKQLQEWIFSSLGPTYRRQLSDSKAKDFSMSFMAIGKDNGLHQSTCVTSNDDETLQRNPLIIRIDQTDDQLDSAKHNIPPESPDSKVIRKQGQIDEILPARCKHHTGLRHTLSTHEKDRSKDYSTSPSKHFQRRSISFNQGVDNILPTLSSTQESNRKCSPTRKHFAPADSKKRPTSAIGGSFGNEKDPNKSKEVIIQRPILTINLKTPRVAPLSSSTALAQYSIRTTRCKSMSSQFSPPSIRPKVQQVYHFSQPKKESHGGLSREHRSPCPSSLKSPKIRSTNRSSKLTQTKEMQQEASAFQPHSFEDKSNNSFPTIYV